MKRALFVIGGAALAVGCGPASSIMVPHGRLSAGGRAASAGKITIDVPDNPTYPAATPTPNPIDPNTGLKIIGGTSTSWGYPPPPGTGGGGWGPRMAMGGYHGASKRSRDLGADLEWIVSDVQHALTQCAGEIAHAAETIAAFTTAAWAAYGPAIQAASGLASLGELGLLEGLGVILTCLSGPEILAISAGVTVSALTLWALYTCLSDL